VSVSLDDQTNGVAELADQYARCFGLSNRLRLALVAAARWHDLGKADRRFQAWLHNGNAQVARLAPKLLAKSGGMPQSARQREQARVRSGYPRGARHELVSVKLAEGLIDRLETPVDRDLVLHLIACHHGHARPFAPLVDDTDPIEVELTFDNVDLRASSATALHQLDSGVAERFWSLARRYGWWGLAWLEALLRLADQRCSQCEREHSPTEEGKP
jgi:CRISPR-associated endonuclease/helicase Cas3